MARTACLVCLVSTVSGRCKNALGRGSANSRHITKLEQSRISFYIFGLTTLDTTYLYLFDDNYWFQQLIRYLKCKALPKGHNSWKYEVLNFSLVGMIIVIIDNRNTLFFNDKII